MLEVIKDVLIDSIKLIPFLFITYLIMEYIEHKMGEKTKNAIQKSGKFGPLIGGILGAFPQCGFSVSATNLYSGGVITLGTLIAVYLSTSDEMLPIMISESVEPSRILKIIGIKVIIGIFAGILIDIIFNLIKKTNQKKLIKSNINNNETNFEVLEENKDNKTNSELIKKNKDNEINSEVLKENKNNETNSEVLKENKNNKINLNKKRKENIIQEKRDNTTIENLCEEEHCHCNENGVVKSALKHTLNIFFYILLITFIIDTIVYFIGEDKLSSFVLKNKLIGPFITSLIGLIPNCAASVIITNMYLENVISTGSLISGLLTGAGVGLAVLFKTNKHKFKENIGIVFLIYFIGVISGIIIELLKITV